MTAETHSQEALNARSRAQFEARQLRATYTVTPIGKHAIIGEVLEFKRPKKAEVILLPVQENEAVYDVFKETADLGFESDPDTVFVSATKETILSLATREIIELLIGAGFESSALQIEIECISMIESNNVRSPSVIREKALEMLLELHPGLYGLVTDTVSLEI